MKNAKRLITLMGVFLCMGMSQAQEMKGFGTAKYDWMSTEWVKPDKFETTRISVQKQVRELIKKRNDRDLNYLAESAFRFWKEKPKDDQRLFEASVWYLEAWAGSYSFGDQKSHVEQYQQLAERWKSAGNPKSAEFSRVGYLIWGVRKIGLNLGDLGKAVFDAFPHDASIIHTVIQDVYENGHFDISFLEKCLKKADSMIGLAPKSYSFLSDHALAYLNAACAEKKYAYLDVAEASATKMLELKPKERITQSDKSLLADIKRLKVLWKDKWK